MANKCSFFPVPGNVSGLLDPQAQPGAAGELFLNPSLLLEGHSRTTALLNVFNKCGCSAAAEVHPALWDGVTEGKTTGMVATEGDILVPGSRSVSEPLGH